ncbi:hypothetical protein DRP77_07165, partial [Candidatus Poribacteria bacterium]
FLTLGIILGARWAYLELGWGGYWAWDPVENASLMPWLTATAFLHSIAPRRGDGVLKLWNISLITATFELCVFGTFLTRSGIVSSVHAFARSPIGHYFLIFIGLSTASAVSLILLRRDTLRNRVKANPITSAERALLTANLILCALCFTTFLGTVFPLLTEVLMGERLMVSPSFFNRLNAPLAALLLALMGAYPWARGAPHKGRGDILIPLLISVSAAIYLGLKFKNLYLVIVASPAGFALLRVFSGILISAAGNLPSLWEHRSRYGGYLSHMGVALLLIGVAFSSLKSETIVEDLKPGGSFDFKGYVFKFEGFSSRRGKNFEMIVGRLKVSRKGREICDLAPGIAYYPRLDEITVEADVRSGFFKDIYAVLLEASEEGASFKIRITPLMSWLWAGCWLTLGGAILNLTHRNWRC